MAHSDISNLVSECLNILNVKTVHVLITIQGVKLHWGELSQILFIKIGMS